MHEYEGQINKSKANIKNWSDKMTFSSFITPLSLWSFDLSWQSIFLISFCNF